MWPQLSRQRLPHRHTCRDFSQGRPTKLAVPRVAGYAGLPLVNQRFAVLPWGGGGGGGGGMGVASMAPTVIKGNSKRFPWFILTGLSECAWPIYAEAFNEEDGSNCRFTWTNTKWPFVAEYVQFVRAMDATMMFWVCFGNTKANCVPCLFVHLKITQRCEPIHKFNWS